MVSDQGQRVYCFGGTSQATSHKPQATSHKPQATSGNGKDLAGPETTMNESGAFTLQGGVLGHGLNRGERFWIG